MLNRTFHFHSFANISECYEGDGGGYRGRKTITKSGRICQNWASQFPQKHTYYTQERQVRLNQLSSVS